MTFVLPSWGRKYIEYKITFHSIGCKEFLVCYNYT